MDARTIVFDYFYFESSDDLTSLMEYLDTDTLVSWFVDEGYVDNLTNDKEEDFIIDYYNLHCK